MRIFQNKWFARFARKNRIDDEALKSAVADIEAGNIDADLGGYVYKQRVARQGQGKRGGYRAIILFRSGERAFFVYGFAKSECANIEDDELADFKLLAKRYLAETGEQLKIRLKDGDIIEIAQEEQHEKIQE
jgi:hypothetical protein